MARVLITAVLALLLTTESAGAQAREVQVYTLMMEGIAAYDGGDFTTAIARYSEALELNPENTLILYERAMAYMAIRDYDLCIRDTESGLGLDSTNEAGLFAMLGSCYSDRGDRDQAIRTFEEGLEVYPDHLPLNFNLAVALSRNGQPARAREYLKKVLEIEPNYTSADILLGQLYQAEGYRIPAIYQYLRFLSTELLTPRAAATSRTLLNLINNGSEPVRDTADVDPATPPDSVPEEERGFADVEQVLAVSTGNPLATTDEATGPSTAEDAVSRVGRALAVTRESAGPELETTWVWQHAVSYLLALEDAGHLEAMSYVAFSELDGAREWIEENDGAVERFLIWREEYPF